MLFFCLFIQFLRDFVLPHDIKKRTERRNLSRSGSVPFFIYSVSIKILSVLPPAIYANGFSVG